MAIKSHDPLDTDTLRPYLVSRNPTGLGVMPCNQQSKPGRIRVIWGLGIRVYG